MITRCKLVLIRDRHTYRASLTKVQTGPPQHVVPPKHALFSPGAAGKKGQAGAGVHGGDRQSPSLEAQGWAEDRGIDHLSSSPGGSCSPRPGGAETLGHKPRLQQQHEPSPLGPREAAQRNLS